MIGPDRFIDYFATGRHSAVRKSAQAARARANGASSVCTGHNPTELLDKVLLTLWSTHICHFYE